MYILEATDIVKQYSNHLALDNASIKVKAGSVFGLLGPNGAGKTTLIRIINRITAPDSGTVLFNGSPIQANDIYKIGYLPEERGLYKKMKVGEQAMYLAQLKGLSKHDAMKRLQEWFEKFNIQGWWNKKIEELSKGMAQKIQFIVTVIHEPELLIFDEPFSGFDPINTALLTKEILALRDKGCTVILSTHNMSSVEALCNDIALINKSKCVLTGNVNEIRRAHGDNIYEISYNGDIEKAQQVLKGLEVLHIVNNSIKVKTEEKYTDNRILTTLASVVEITGYNEAIPTMNDIFIKVVGGR